MSSYVVFFFLFWKKESVVELGKPEPTILYFYENMKDDIANNLDAEQFSWGNNLQSFNNCREANLVHKIDTPTETSATTVDSLCW